MIEMTPSTLNLNSRLRPAAPKVAAAPAIGTSWKATAIRSSAPPVRIVGAGSRYHGGYLVNV